MRLHHGLVHLKPAGTLRFTSLTVIFIFYCNLGSNKKLLLAVKKRSNWSVSNWNVSEKPSWWQETNYTRVSVVPFNPFKGQMGIKLKVICSEHTENTHWQAPAGRLSSCRDRKRTAEPGEPRRILNQVLLQSQTRTFQTLQGEFKFKL